MQQVLIAGFPNSGKTVLFNALTQSRARVGNWSGVTVDIQTANMQTQMGTYAIQDLPGLHALMDAPDSQDEQIALTHLTQSNPACIINVIHAAQLERQLFLTSELAELGLPIIIVLSMPHIASAQGITLHPEALASAFNCPVHCFNPSDKQALHAIKASIAVQCETQPIPKPLSLSLPPEYTAHLEPHATFFQATQALLSTPKYNDFDLHLADARYNAVHQLAQTAQTGIVNPSDTRTAKLDKLLLHRWLGLPLFFLIIYVLFLFSVQVGGRLQENVDQATQFLFVQLPSKILYWLHAPGWLTGIIADGIGKGLNTTLTFIPVLGAMYFSLAALEASGYMARAAFLMDKFMRFLGLPGKAFVPLIIGFGCNVPAILATRTLQSARDRALTVFMAPFMSCSARLAIYTVFVSAFFPENGQNIIFMLYLLGIAVAILTGFILQKTLLRSQAAPLFLELPAYQFPPVSTLLKTAWHRLSHFLVRAGRLIVPVCLGLSLVNLIPSPFLAANPTSLLAWIGQTLTPLFSPMGISQDNWSATVGLLTGVLAKEVVIGSLNTLYQQLQGISAETLLLSASAQQTGTPFLLQQHFKTAASIYAYLSFILLYLPCISTMAAIKQETHARYMWMSIAWSFFIAYVIAVMVYQVCSFSVHPLSASIWLVGLSLLFLACYFCLKRSVSLFGASRAI